MTALTVLYDPTCGLCRRAHEWLAQQRKLIELVFVPCKSDEARRRFPQLDHDLTAKDLTVIGDRGRGLHGSESLAHGSVGTQPVSRVVLPTLVS